MSNLRVIICTSGPEAAGSKQNWALARALAAAGHQVTLLVDQERHDLVGSWEGCTVLTWPSRRPVHWRDAFFLWILLGEFKPVAILANFGSVNLSMLLGFLRRVPVRVAWYRTLTDQIALDCPEKDRWKLGVKIKRKSFVYRFATHIVPVSEKSKADVCTTFSVPEEKCQIFHTCREDPLEVLGSELPEKAAEMRIVCVARLNISKGQDILMRAVQELRRLKPEWPLTVELVGEGPERASYERLAEELGISDLVKFAGFVEHKEVFRRIARAQVMVVTFRTDAGPGVIAEGLGLGMPLVVSASGAMPGQIGDASAVLFVPPEDPKALAAALQRILENPELQEKMSRAARELFLAKFHVNFWVNGVVQWLLEISGGQ